MRFPSITLLIAAITLYIASCRADSYSEYITLYSDMAVEQQELHASPPPSLWHKACWRVPQDVPHSP